MYLRSADRRTRRADGQSSPHSRATRELADWVHAVDPKPQPVVERHPIPRSRPVHCGLLVGVGELLQVIPADVADEVVGHMSRAGFPDVPDIGGEG